MELGVRELIAKLSAIAAIHVTPLKVNILLGIRAILGANPSSPVYDREFGVLSAKNPMLEPAQ